MATVQLRNPTEGPPHYDRKKAAGKTSMEAMRSLERRFSDIVYQQLLADALRPLGASLGGQRGRHLDPARPDSHPDRHFGSIKSRSLPTTILDHPPIALDTEGGP